MKDQEDILALANRLVHFTNEHIYLTGKAGTGKTTFLKNIRQTCSKKMVVVAPTGVAAINAGGVTIHSLFQLPPGAYIPDTDQFGDTESGKFISHRGLLKNIRFGAAKREIFQELELLIIDEVSMLRADMLDAMNIILQSIRNNRREPFGGVQVMYIGDLYQLPPVIGNDEWDVLKSYYKSPFFFDAHVIEKVPPVYIELEKIYRQSEGRFIDVLNCIRNNEITEDEINYLNRRYDPYFIPDENDSVVVLTTHNYKADKINNGALNQLQTQEYIFKGTITDDFNEKVLPVDMDLRLKKGAQVMFIRNDKGEDRQYYNGKIGTVTDIGDDYITVTSKENEDSIELKKEIWENIRYVYNPDKDVLDEEVMGSYSQYPLRLAWAITIHKSQGLTFEKAVIDAVDSFSPGQVYVALSRLTGLDGLVLSSPIHQNAIQTDERIGRYKDYVISIEEVKTNLDSKQDQFLRETILKGFRFTKLAAKLKDHLQSRKLLLIEGQESITDMISHVSGGPGRLDEVGIKFNHQLERLFSIKKGDDYSAILQRVEQAVAYFTREISMELEKVNEIIGKLSAKKGMKKRAKEMMAIRHFYHHQLDQIQRSFRVLKSLAEKTDVMDALKPIIKEETEEPSKIEKKQELTKKKKKQEKGSTNTITLDLYKQGKSIEEIAIERGMVASTIEGHLSYFIGTGELDVHDFVTEDKLHDILDAIMELDTEQLSPIRNHLGESYSYGEIKMAVAYYKKEI